MAKSARSTRSRRSPRRRSRSRRLPWGLFGRLLLVLGLCGLVALAWLDAWVRQKFDDHQWALPARVYAQPVELFAGRTLTPEHLEKMMALLRYRSDPAARTPGSFSRQGGTWLIHTRGFRDTDGGEPARTLRLVIQDQRLNRLTDGRGERVAVARLEPLQVGSIHPRHNQDRILVQLDRVPATFHDMLLATEDRDYYDHFGVSLRGLARAMWTNLRHGHMSQGGSTLTQQLVKNFWLTRERSLMRKLTELPMAVLLELHYSKQQILETYLNEVYLGQDGARAIHGVGLAAQFYFGRDLTELEPHHHALLVGLLKGPSHYDPRRAPERALARRNVVLRVAHEQGILDDAQLQAALARDLEVVPRGASALYAFPHFIDLVRRQLARDYPPEVLSSEGLQIRSTLDVLVQLAAEDALARELARHGDGLNGAVVVTAPAQGDVLAVVGDRTARSTGFNRALDAVRPIGSLAKPVVMLTALEQPQQYSLATLVDDVPFTVNLPNGQSWSPRNADRRSLGLIPLVDALAASRNQATAQLGMAVGLERVVDTFRRLGAQGQINAFPSLTLGSHDMTPFAVAALYQPLANGGFRTPMRSITDVLAPDGRPLARYPINAEPVIDAVPAFLLQWGMHQVITQGTGRALSRYLSPSLAVAGKTGTTDDGRDAWFAGFSGNYLAVVWVGRDDNQPTGLGGASGALPVWGRLMAGLPQRSLRLDPPAGVEWVWMSADGRHRIDPDCPGARQYPLAQASVPVEVLDCQGRVITVPDSDASGDTSERGLRGWLRRMFD